MKRLTMIAVFIIGSASSVFADPAAEKDKLIDNLSGTVVFYGDSIHSKDKDRSEYWTKAFIKYHKLLDVGLEIGYAPTGDYSHIRAYAGPIVGPVALFGGYTFDSNRKEFAVGGLKYATNIGAMGLSVDTRVYAALSEKARSYWDTLYEATYKIHNFRIGANVIYDKYLTDDTHDYVLAGPIIYYDINKNVRIFGRFAGDWSMTSRGTDRSTRARLGLMVTF